MNISLVYGLEMLLLGVGTATFYEPKTGLFVALGHGITDIDTGKIVEISNGELTSSTIVAIKKGEKGSPR